MKHTDIEKLAKEWIVDSADSPANPRVQAITLRLVTDLCKAIEDLDITPTEFWKGLEYFSEAGARNELGLLAPGIGLERFLDMRSDEADERAGLTGGTPRAIEGPLYVAGAPESKGFARMDDGTEVDKAETLFMQGTVYGADGKPLFL
jgi:catechol 1,2-dioxygenase